MKDTTLTLKLRGLEAELLEKMVRLGLFRSESEAVRAVVMKCGVDWGLLSRDDLWNRLKAYKRRKLGFDALKKDLQGLEKHSD